MECQEHQTMNMDSCEKKTSNFGSKFKLACFLLDILSHISYNSWYYCYCNFSDKCLMCRIPNIFDEIEKNIYDDVLGYNFLEKYHQQLYPLLLQIFVQKKDCICCFLHQEYENKGRD